VEFSAFPSTDLDGSVAAYLFSFGDGTDSGWVTGPNVSHVYDATGNYTMTLRVRDNRGGVACPPPCGVHHAGRFPRAGAEEAEAAGEAAETVVAAVAMGREAARLQPAAILGLNDFGRGVGAGAVVARSSCAGALRRTNWKVTSYTAHSP